MVPAIVSSGEEAIKEAEKFTPDLVLMDVVLKGEIDGIEAADQIHARFNVPIVYATAYADEGLMERAKITEPFGYITKPFEVVELHTAIEMALYKHKIEKKMRESEAKYRRLFEATKDGIIVTNPDGRILFVNPSYVEMLGYNSSEELIGKPAIEIIFKT